MTTMPSNDQNTFIQNVERVIHHTNDGMEPTAALVKVAKEEQWAPEFIHRAAQAFNKSLSVARFTSGTSDKQASFPLADPHMAIEQIFNPAPPTHKVAFSLPSGQYATDDIAPPIARTSITVIDEDLAVRTYWAQQKAAGERVAMVDEQLRMDTEFQKRAFHSSLDELIAQLRPLSPFNIRKVAQNMVNAYARDGHRMVGILEKRLRVDLPGIEKRAHGFIFPKMSPYLAITGVFDCARRWAEASVARKNFQEKAAGLGSSLAAQTALRLLNPRNSINTALSSKKKVPSIDQLDPSFRNRLTALDSRRQFTNLLLYDQDLVNYDYPDVLKAYNNAVGLVPSSAGSPGMLKNLMMRDLQTGGRMDPFEMSQAADLENTLGEATRGRKQDLQAEMAAAAAAAEEDPLIPMPAVDLADLVPIDFKDLIDKRQAKHTKSREDAAAVAKTLSQEQRQEQRQATRDKATSAATAAKDKQKQVDTAMKQLKDIHGKSWSSEVATSGGVGAVQDALAAYYNMSRRKKTTSITPSQASTLKGLDFL